MKDFKITFTFGEPSLSIHPFLWHIKPEKDQLLNLQVSYHFLCFELIKGR